MSQHLNPPNENQAINHYTRSIHSAEHRKMNGVWVSKYHFLFHFLFPSSTTILHSVVFFHTLFVSLSLSVSCGSYLVLLHHAVLLLLRGRLPGYQNSCAVVSASRYGDLPGSGAGRCDNRHERDVTHTLQYTRVLHVHIHLLNTLNYANMQISHVKCMYICIYNHYVDMYRSYVSVCEFSETHVSTHFNSTHSAVLVHLNNERRLPSNMIGLSQCQMPAERILELRVNRMLSLDFISHNYYPLNT